MPLSKPVHRSHNTNQSCVLLSFKTCNKKFSLFHDFIILLCRFYENIFRFFDDSANKTKAFSLKVNCKELALVFYIM